MRSRLRRGALVVLLVTALCGCSSGSATGGGHRKVAFVLANHSLSFAIQMGEGFSAGVSRIGGVDQEVVGPEIVDGAKQVKMFQDLTKTARDGISVYTLSPDLFAAPLAAAAAADIPLIAVDNKPPAGAGVELYVGNDNYQLGRMLADEVISELSPGAKGTVVVGTRAPGVPVLDRRAKGIHDAFRAKLPGVKVLGPFDTKQELAANLAAWRTLTTVNSHALAFLGTGSADGWNLATIRRETRAKWRAGAFDLDPKSLTAVKAGDLVVVSPEHFVKGEIAGYLQAEHAKDGEPLPKGWIYIPGVTVNKANVDTYIARQASSQATAAAVEAQVDAILHDATYLRSLSEAS